MANSTSAIIKVYADKIYYKKINENTGAVWTINDVPQKYRSAVEAELARRG